MKLQIKFVLYVSAVLIVSLFFTGVLIFSNSKVNLESRVNSGLESTSLAVKTNLENFLEAQKNKIELIATQSSLTEEELIKMIELDESFYDFFVIDSNGIVIVSSNPDRIGLDRRDRCYFKEARDKTAICPVYLALVPKEYSISVSTPFNGGVLVGAMKIDILNKVALVKNGVGETEEILLAFYNDKDELVYFSERLFSENKYETISRDTAETRPIGRAMMGEETLINGFKDYRNVSVLSFTRYLRDIKVGMVAKIDETEAFSEISKLREITIFIVGISMILIIFLIYIVTSSFSREIKDISGSIEEITRGNLDIQLKKSGIFEIQNLINSLNRILATMKLAILRTGLSKGELGLGEVVKAKEEAEEKYKLLYESSSDAIMTLEPPTWKFSAGNPAAIKMFEARDEKDFTSRAPWEFSPTKQLDGTVSSIKAKRMIEKALKDGKNLFNWTHKRLTGEEFSASVLLTKVKEGDKESLQATVRDLSMDLKEKEIKEKNPELYKKLVYLKKEADKINKKEK